MHADGSKSLQFLSSQRTTCLPTESEMGRFSIERQNLERARSELGASNTLTVEIWNVHDIERSHRTRKNELIPHCSNNDID